MGDVFNNFNGEWLFVKSRDDKYIGRCVSISDDKKTVELQPAFHYISEYFQNEQGSISRNLLITPIELCIGFESTAVVNDITLMLSFDKMSTEDRKEFQKAVRQGVDGMIEAKAAKAGITLEQSMLDKSSGGILFG